MSGEYIKHPLNVPGQFYVTDACLFCEVCTDAAPHNFRLGEDASSYVYKQPETPAEERQCRAALAGCPMQAIYDDGESRLTLA